MTADRPVRARTRAGRLSLIDEYLASHEAALLARGAFIDVGFGETPVTTIEAANALRGVCPGLEVVGVEREPGRVRSALAAKVNVRFVEAGFDGLVALPPACVVRAVNVLRAYREDEVPAIHEALGVPVVEGGLVIEGSTDVEGHLGVVHLLRKSKTRALESEGLLFFTDFERGFAPMMFRDVLPRDLRRRVKAGEPIHELLTRWQVAFETVRHEVVEDMTRFLRTVPAEAVRCEGRAVLLSFPA